MDDVKFSLSDRAKADKKLVVGGMFNTVSDIEVVSPTKGIMQFSRPPPGQRFCRRVNDERPTGAAAICGLVGVCGAQDSAISLFDSNS